MLRPRNPCNPPTDNIKKPRARPGWSGAIANLATKSAIANCHQIRDRPILREYLWSSANMWAYSVMATEAVRLGYTTVEEVKEVQKRKKFFEFNVEVRAKSCYYGFSSDRGAQKKGH